ncbi:AraC family transcriptional regulator [Candidatus Aerophobetes bacterium]|uniref:AraC family transcriptional regulator n=1 Tax=Aerophobetes bacterium TaxID=2030807 RepID=A0A2A4X839_UNCAE|nr:MAG: AraC family transcriptional regulator [Candidatus Aerophobetes bacterium]
MECEKKELECKILALQPKKIVGLEIRTTNENNQSAKDIGDLWTRFYQEGTHEKISNKVSQTVYAIYTKYESDHTKPFSFIIGCEVKEKPSNLPEGCSFCETKNSSYAHLPLEGNFPESLFTTWKNVWCANNFDRAFTTDIEAYDESFDIRSGSSQGATLYIAIK